MKRDIQLKTPKQIIGNNFRNLTLNKFPKLYRPDSLPYVSGDTFRKFADHIFDESKSIDPKKVQNNDIVFLKTDLKEIYFDNFHNEIKTKYIVVCHNSDTSFQPGDMKYIDDKIIHCFTQNLDTLPSAKVSPIPIGFENARFRNNGKTKLLKKYDQKFINKKDGVFCSFNTHTNYQIRSKIKELISGKDNFYFKQFKSFDEYLANISCYKFVLCPPGNGIDTHRVWETLLVGGIPIVEKNFLYSEFSRQGMPLIMIDNWEKIEEIDFDYFLNYKLNLKKEVSWDSIIRFKYWSQKIDSVKS